MSPDDPEQMLSRPSTIQYNHYIQFTHHWLALFERAYNIVPRFDKNKKIKIHYVLKAFGMTNASNQCVDLPVFFFKTALRPLGVRFP